MIFRMIFSPCQCVLSFDRFLISQQWQKIERNLEDCNFDMNQLFIWVSAIEIESCWRHEEKKLNRSSILIRNQRRRSSRLRRNNLSLQTSEKRWLNRINLCLLQTKLKMSEAALPVKNNIESRLLCIATLMLNVSWLIIISIIDDDSTGEREISSEIRRNFWMQSAVHHLLKSSSLLIFIKTISHFDLREYRVMNDIEFW